MKKTRFFLFFLFLLLGCVLSSESGAALPARAQTDVWLPGQYSGWVYFLARSDYEYHRSGEGIIINGAGAIYHEVHGTVDCSVFDEDGNGTCFATYPLDFTLGFHHDISSPDCTMTVDHSARAMGVSPLMSPASLIPFSLNEKFSLPFNPEKVPAQTKMVVQGSGGIGCSNAAIAAEIPQGIEWSDLDYSVGFHTPLAVGGTCNMADFPRQMSTSFGSTGATILDCRWQMFYFDPTVELPEE